MAKIYANSELTPTQWASATWKEALDRVFWRRFIGRDEMSPIVQRSELNGKPGDTITFGFTMQLDGEGVTSGQTLEGSEDSFDEYAMSITIDELCNGIRLAGPMEEQKQADNLRLKAKQLLRNWFAQRQDQIIFNQMSADTTETFANTPVAVDSDHVLYGGDATGTSDITAGDTFTTEEITRLVYQAQAISPELRAVRIAGGWEGYYMVVHPRCAYTLWQDSEWVSAQQAAYTGRGEEMPFFRRDLFLQGYWKNVAVYEHRKVRLETDWGSGGTTTGAINLFFGAQAGAYVEIQNPWWREKTFDFGREVGFATGAIWGFKVCRFNSKYLGLIHLKTVAAAPSGSDHA